MALALGEPDAPAVRRVFATRRDPFLMPWSTLTETTSMLVLRSSHYVMSRFLQTLPGSGLSIVDLLPADLLRASELCREYLDSRFDFVDATIVAYAERRNIRQILTLDHRCFSMVRPKHCPSFELLP